MDNEKDHIFIENFEISCQIGDSEEERAFPQVVDMTIRIFLPLKKAGQDDSLDGTVDYAKIINSLIEGTSKKVFVLQEALAEWACTEILKNDAVDSVSVQVSKKNFPGIRRVGVCLHRKRND